MTAQDVAFRDGLKVAFDEILLIIEMQDVHVEVLTEERDTAVLERDAALAEVARLQDAVMYLNGDSDA